MAKLNTTSLGRLISSTVIVDSTTDTASLWGRYTNYRETNKALREIQPYYPGLSRKTFCEKAVAIYHSLQEASQIGDLVNMAKEWRADKRFLVFIPNLTGVSVTRVRINREELQRGTWAQIQCKFVHQGTSGYEERFHLFQKKLVLQDSQEDWRVRLFQN